ncbi:MAG: glycosyltransferase family 4 protein [bacterium]|nr:glycosyltransferase family 4 protein [bacterium]
MKKKLRIAQIAPLWVPVPPRTYGGIELMTNNLILGLQKRGHDVTLFASGDSTVDTKLRAPIDKALWLQKDIRNPHAAIIKMLHMIKSETKSFDIIHNHFNFFMFPLAMIPDMSPMLTSIRSPLDEMYAETIKLFPQIHFSVLSNDARQAAAEFGVNVRDIVYNGIEVKRYSFNDQPQDYLLYLGRVNRQKGILTALRVAKRAGLRLIVAGNIVGAAEWTYFMQEVQPQLDDEHVKFVGQVNFQEKIELMKNAKGFLFPIEGREAFGNVMIESMACGTPVVAFRQGSVPEVVAHGKTGFVVDNEEEMVEAVFKIDEIDRKTCRKRVEDCFTVDGMVDGYEKIYQKILE